MVGFVKLYFPVFLLGAVFGKLIELSGFSRSIVAAGCTASAIHPSSKIPDRYVRRCLHVPLFRQLMTSCRCQSLVQGADGDKYPAPSKLYTELETLISPEAIVASNTSGLPPDDLAAKMRYPQRLLIARFMSLPVASSGSRWRQISCTVESPVMSAVSSGPTLALNRGSSTSSSVGNINFASPLNHNFSRCTHYNNDIEESR